MGSGKDHKKKKDHKHHHKRKHKRSDSEERSPEPKRSKKDKEHKSKKQHKHHKNESRERYKSPTPNDTNGKNSVTEDVSIEEEEVVYVNKEPVDEPRVADDVESQFVQRGKSDESLSIEETNKIREKLGLKPLNVGNSSTDDPSAKAEFVHAPAADLWKKKKEAEIREKINSRKQKRLQEKKMSKVKTLGEESDEEGISSWVMKSREKEKALKIEKELNEAGDEFGLGDLVKKEFKPKERDYTEKDLKGLSVEHSLESFKEGLNTVLVIKDKDILDDNDEDVLHSVTIQDKEKAKKNLEIKKRGIGYKAYEDDEVDDMGFFQHKSVLNKYDEEIDGEVQKRFVIGESGMVDTSWEQQKESMKKEIRAKGESLALPPLRLASEYLTSEEMTFKKRKRKVKKTRKREMLKPDDILPLPGDVGGGQDHGSRSKSSKSSNKFESDDKVIFDEDDASDELQRALEKSRKAKQLSSQTEDSALKVVQQIETISQLNLEKPDQNFSTVISLNATDEFCRQLGAQTASKEPAPPSDDIQEVDMDVDDEEDEEEIARWSSVVPGEEKATEKSHNPEVEEHAPIEAEPLAAGGLMGALKLAQHKGYLSEEKKKGSSTVITNTNSNIQAKFYSIEDKNAVDYLDKYAHEKYTKDRSRHDRGMVSEFVEKKDYKPKIEIEYVDERGRALSAKEAFRKLSHRFHGKGSGKTKQEKRMKKIQEEDTMKKMSSTDTPLNTVAMMKSKLKTESSAYIVLSGAGKTLMSGGDSLAKK